MSEAPQFIFQKDLIEHQAENQGDKPYILHEEDVVSFKEYNLATRRAANGIVQQGASPGDGVALLMGNCLEYLYLFYGLPRAGLYSVPINVSLKKDGLRYIIENSDAKYLIVDDVLYPKIMEFDEPVAAIEKIFIHRTTDQPLPAGTIDLNEVFDAPDAEPVHEMDSNDISYLMYTSGTTGFPKGVVNRNGIGAAAVHGTICFPDRQAKPIFKRLPQVGGTCR